MPDIVRRSIGLSNNSDERKRERFEIFIFVGWINGRLQGIESSPTPRKYGGTKLEASHRELLEWLLALVTILQWIVMKSLMHGTWFSGSSPFHPLHWHHQSDRSAHDFLRDTAHENWEENETDSKIFICIIWKQFLLQRIKIFQVCKDGSHCTPPTDTIEFRILLFFSDFGNISFGTSA
jgi:hypothetical protein